jgi:exonuclease V
MSPQNVIPSCLENREKVLEPPDCGEGTEAEGSTSSTSAVNPPIMLYLKDNKTRRHPSVPPHYDTLSGRLQLMLYRRLLSQLVAKSPLYDFNPLWKRLGVKSSSRLPTKFLVQANLISDNTDFQTTSLDDVVTSWHKLVKEANVQGVNENLELVYRLRPPPNGKQKSKVISFPEVDNCNTPKDMPTPKVAASENSTACPSNHMGATVTEGLGALPSVSDLEDAQLQWALRQSMMPLADQEDGFPGGK